jgi:hypothetical protein
MISRKEFLKRTATGAVGVASIGVLGVVQRRSSLEVLQEVTSLSWARAAPV